MKSSLSLRCLFCNSGFLKSLFATFWCSTTNGGGDVDLILLCLIQAWGMSVIFFGDTLGDVLLPPFLPLLCLLWKVQRKPRSTTEVVDLPFPFWRKNGKNGLFHWQNNEIKESTSSIHLENKTSVTTEVTHKQGCYPKCYFILPKILSVSGTNRLTILVLKYD